TARDCDAPTGPFRIRRRCFRNVNYGGSATLCRRSDRSVEVSWPEARGSVRRLLERMPPPLRELIGSLQKIGVPEQGATSDVIFVSGSNGRFVVKRATRPPYHDWLRREHEVLGSLSPQTAFIPKPLGFVEEPDRGRPSNWLLMEHLPGVPLSDVLRRGVGS